MKYLMTVLCCVSLPVLADVVPPAPNYTVTVPAATTTSGGGLSTSGGSSTVDLSSIVVTDSTGVQTDDPEQPVYLTDTERAAAQAAAVNGENGVKKYWKYRQTIARK